MRLIRSDTIAFADVAQEGARGCRMRELITGRVGAPTFAMRQFEIDPGGTTPYHSHPWEHEVYIQEGTGKVRTESGPRPFASGDAIFVPPDELHCFANTGESRLRFLCLIPVDQSCCR